MALGRREFLRLGGAGLAVAGFDPRALFSQSSAGASPPALQALLGQADGYPFPYDAAAFASAERVFNVRRNPIAPETFEGSVSLLLQPGKTLDLKLLAAETVGGLTTTSDVQSFTGVRDSLEARISGYAGPRVYYQVQYRDGGGAWKALAPRSFKLPSADLDAGGVYKIILVADDHTFDDAEYAVAAAYKETKLSGDYVNVFLNSLRTNPNWNPPNEPLGRLKNGLCLARALNHILQTEDADLLVNLGDTNGLGAPYRWAAFGLPTTNLKDADYDFVARTLWLRMRKLYSAVTPYMPMVIAMGNHDGEESWSPTRSRSRVWRNQYFAFPDAQTYPEGGDAHGAYFAFSLGADAQNRGGARFIILDVTGFTSGVEPAKPEGWTLGHAQLAWLETLLAKGEKHWNFACYHHVLGGWPTGPTELESHIAYGRGPLFQAKDYQPFTNPAGVEQVALTELALKYGLQAFFYGHDHIFKPTHIARGASQKDLYGVCAGSTKYMGESAWWNGANWQKYYGQASKRPPDFWGPPGYVRLTVKAGSVKVEYVAAGYSPYSNLTSGQKAGDVLSGLTLSSPAPKLAVDRSAITLESTPQRGFFPSLPLRVQNGGGGALAYRVRSTVPWLSVSPAAGKSWGEWREHALIVAGRGFEEGTYEGSVVVEAEGGGAGPVEVPVKLVLGPRPLSPPSGFTAAWSSERMLLSVREVILLTWRPSRLNGQVAGYRLYLLDDRGGRTRLAEVSARTMRFAYAGATRGRPYRFGLTAFDARGRESETAVASVG